MGAFVERRKHRSEIPIQAVRFQLQAGVCQGKWEAMVLADDQGLVIAQSHECAEVEEVAAFSPLLATPKPWTGVVQCQSGPRPVVIRPVSVGPACAYLCAIGGKSPGFDSTLEQTALGVQRILGS